VVSEEPPTPVETDGLRAVRRIRLPPEALTEGPYFVAIRLKIV